MLYFVDRRSTGADAPREGPDSYSGVGFDAVAGDLRQCLLDTVTLLEQKTAAAAKPGLSHPSGIAIALSWPVLSRRNPRQYIHSKAVNFKCMDSSCPYQVLEDMGNLLRFCENGRSLLTLRFAAQNLQSDADGGST